MPLYEYQCEKCGRFELIRKFSDEPVTACPTCGREVRKLFSAPAIQFKGTGWYVTDYARKSQGDDGASSKDGSKDGSRDGSKDGPKDGSKDGSKDSSSKDGSSTAATTTSKGGSASGSPK